MSNSAAVVNHDNRISALFESFDRLDDPFLTDFTSAVPENFGELVSRVINEGAVVSDFVLNNRTALKSVVGGFHREADTYSAPVHESIQLLEDPTTKIVVSTHQPNLFAYSGVLKKIVLLEKLREVTQERSNGKVVNLFLIVDHDFLDENWIRMAQLPSMRHSSGIMELRLPIDDTKRWQLVCNAPLPSKNVVRHWKRQINSWIKACTESHIEKRKVVNSNLDSYWRDVVEPAYSRAHSYSDLNAFMMSVLVNRIWGYGTIFVRLSQLSRVFENGYTFLLSNAKTYSEALRGIEARLMANGIDTGISPSSYLSAPVWLHCECGSKASVKIVMRDGLARLEGPCMSCKKLLDLNLGNLENLDLSGSSALLSPRAIPIPLLLTRDLGISCYCSGTGGIGYLVDGSFVAKRLSLKFPLIAVWASKDRYLGIGQSPPLSNSDEWQRDFESELSLLYKTSELLRTKMIPLLNGRREAIKKEGSAAEYLSNLFSVKEEQRKIRQQISEISKAQNIAKLAPCFIDYAVNFGMSRTEQLWSDHLIRDGRLASSVAFAASA